jgi:hypothetical protein
MHSRNERKRWHARLPVTADAEGVVLLPAGVLGSVVVTVTLANATVLEVRDELDQFGATVNT